MKRSSRFLIAFAAAAVTFGSLTAFIGPRHWQHYRHGHCYAEASHSHPDHWNHGHWHENRPHPGHNPKAESDTSHENQ